MQGSRRNAATVILATIAGTLLVFSLLAQCAVAQNVCTITGTVLNISLNPVAGAEVHFRPVAPQLSGVVGIAVEDLTTVSASDGTWSLVVVEGLKTQIDIAAIGFFKDAILPSCTSPNPSTIAFTSLSFFNRGSLTPATVISLTGPSFGGDLFGPSPNPKVIGFRGVTLLAGLPTNGQGYFYKSSTGRFELMTGAAAISLAGGGSGVVSSVSAGTGIALTGTATDPVVNVATGGITTTQLSVGVNATLSGAVQKSGDTMTGLLTLSGNSVTALQAVPQQELTAGLATKLGVGGSIPESQVIGLIGDLVGKVNTSAVGAANGVAPLDSGSKVPLVNLPATLPPSTHAITHAIGGTDPVSPASIGAANIVHGHAQADVSGLVTALADTAKLSATNTFPLIQIFNGGILVPGGFSPSGNFIMEPGSIFGMRIATPGTPSTTASVTGGSLASGIYYYVITALDGGGGETIRSGEAAQAVFGPNASVGLTWVAIPAASSYRVYRGTSAGAESTYFSVTNSSYTDIGTSGTAASPPSSNTAYGVRLSASAASWAIGGSVGIGKATPSTALDVLGTTTSTAFVGPLTGAVTGNVTGNVSGTAATITGIETPLHGGLGIDASGSTGFPKFTAGSVAIAPLIAGDIPNLPASQITSGQLALARGGLNADISGTGGASQVLRQSAPGAAVTVSQLAYTDLTGTPAALPPNGAASGDLSGSYPGPTVAKINGTSVPVGGALVTGNVPQVTGVSTLSYAPLNLAGGANFVTGLLPAGNVGNLPASQITSGLLALARGAGHADFSATGGPNMVVKQSSVGADFTVAGLVSGDIPNNAANTSGTASSATSFTGPLIGDVTGTQGATVVSTVAASSAANVHAAELLANAATALNTASAIARRSAGGDIASTTFTGAHIGNATTASDGLTTAVGTPPLNFSLVAKALTGSVDVMTGATGLGNGFPGLVPTPLIADVAKCLKGDGTWGTCATGSVSSVALALPASTFTISGSPVTSSGTLTGTFATQNPNLIFAGPASGGAATPTWRLLVSADIPNNASAAGSFTGSLAGDVTGTQGATVVSLVGGSTAANVNTATVDVNTNATAAATANRLVRRDGSAGAAFGIVTDTQTVVANAGSALDLVDVSGLLPRLHLKDTTAVTGGGMRLDQAGLVTTLKNYTAADALSSTVAAFGPTATTTPLWDKGGAVYNVKAYGAKCDNSTDDTASITAAISAATSGGLGSIVYFPQGTCVISGVGGLTALPAGMTLRGSGAGSTIIKNATNAAAVIKPTALGVVVTDMALQSTGTGATVGLDASADNACRYERLKITGAKTGILGGNSSTFVDIAISALSASATGIDKSTAGSTNCTYVRVSVTGTGYVDGIIAANTVGQNIFDTCVVNVSATHAAMSLSEGSALPSTVVNCTLQNLNNTTGTFCFEALGTIVENCTIGGGGNGLYVSGGTVVNTFVSGAGEDGIVLLSGTLVGCSSKTNSRNTSNTFANLLLPDSSSGPSHVLGGAYTTGSAAFAKYGIKVGTSVTNYTIDGVDLAGLTAKSLGIVPAAAIASASTIAPTVPVVHVSGTTPINTITVPTSWGRVGLIADGAWTWTAAGNIATAGAAVAGVIHNFYYDDTLLKWYPERLSNIPVLTAGSVPFASAAGTLTQDNANLFWDNTNKRLGIGTVTPAALLEISDPTSNNGLRITSAVGASSFNLYTTDPAAGNRNWRVSNRYSALGAFDILYSTTLGGVPSVSALTIQNTGAVSIAATLAVAGVSSAISQQVTASANGATMVSGSTTETITLSTVAAFTDSSANLLPANSLIDAVTCRVQTNITTAATWSLGDATTTARFSPLAANQTAGSTVSGRSQMAGVVTTTAAGPTQDAAAKLRITNNVTPGAGVIVCTSFWRTFNPPTS